MLSNSLLILEHFLTIVSFLLTIVFISLILRSRKSPASTFVWLIAITAIPYIGIPLYLFFSERKFIRKSRQKTALFSTETRFNQTPLSARRVERILLAGGCPPRREHQEVEFLETGEKAYHTLIEMIHSAESSIQIETFIFGNDPVAHQIKAALTKRARDGIHVQVLVDAVGSSWMNHPSFSELKSAGAKIAYFTPLFHFPLWGRSNLRNHRKMILIDGKTVLIGGMNIAQEYLGPQPDADRWIDLSIKIKGTLVKDLQAIFLSDWNYTLESNDLIPSLVENQNTSTSELQVAASGPDVPSDPIYEALISAIFDAQTRIWISTPYFIPDEALTKALELAAKRGVDVRLLIPEHSNHTLADLSRGSFIRQLQSAGAQIFLFPKMIHAKAILFDQSSIFIGSANMDLRSLLLNYEVGVFLYSIKEIQKASLWFDRLFSVSKVGFKKTGFFGDLAEGVGRLLSPLL